MSVPQLAVKLNNNRTYANTEHNKSLERFFKYDYKPTYKIQNEGISIDNPIDTSGKCTYSSCNVVFDSRGIFDGNYLNDFENSNACVLNPGNLQRPGGSVLLEKGSLEEALFRNTLLADSLFKAFVDGIYYIPNLRCRKCINNPYNRNVVCQNVIDLTNDKECFQRGIYSSNVPVSTGSSICHDYVTVATPKLPDNKSNITPDFWNEYDEIMLNMIRMIIVSAINHGRTTLILCALGCGWFKNPPERVAEAFRKVLIDENRIQYFKKIIFPILAVKGGRGSYTYQKFYNAFAKAPNLSISQVGDRIVE